MSEPRRHFDSTDLETLAWYAQVQPKNMVLTLGNFVHERVFTIDWDKDISSWRWADDLFLPEQSLREMGWAETMDEVLEVVRVRTGLEVKRVDS